MKRGRLGLIASLFSILGNSRRGERRASAIGQMAIMLLVPQWVWLAGAIALVFGAVLAIVIVAADSSTTSEAADLQYQCDSAIGPDPSVTETFAPAASETMAPVDIPTANPFAQLTIAPDDAAVDSWERACVTQMRTAPYQLPPLNVPSTGPAVACARELALGQVGKRSSGDDAAWSAAVIAMASLASDSGRCDAAANPPALGNSTDAAANQGGAQVDSCPPTTSTTAPSAAVALPSALVVQGVCGQRVAPAAVSAGDLVFWNYRNFVPTCVGIAVGPTEIVTSDPMTGQMVRESMPTGSGVRVKRVLRGGS